ncbi:MAG: hypothetical protein FWC57_00015, partial [Endomicrobia bacterium]|nr:hypothetical protein [Endomicrobiia bacterium]
LTSYWCDILGDGGSVRTEDDMYPRRDDEWQKGISAGVWKFKGYTVPDLQKLQPFGALYRFPSFDAALDYMTEPYIKAGEPRRLKLVFMDNDIIGHTQWLDVKVYAPQGVEVRPGPAFSAHIPNVYNMKVEYEVEIFAENFSEPRIDIVFDITSRGRHTNHFIKATLIPEFRANRVEAGAE